MFNEKLWEDIWKKLHDLIHDGVKEFKGQVFYGEKYPLDKYPCAFICPGEIRSTPKTMQESHWTFIFEIGIGVKGDDPKQNYLDVYHLANLVTSAILEDRHLSTGSEKLVHNTEVLSIVVNWRDFSRGLETQWLGVIVECQEKM